MPTWGKLSPRNNFHILVSLSWKVHTTNLPFPPFFTLHVGKVGILKRQMDSFIGFTKKECPDRTMSCDPVDHLGEKRESYPSPFWLVSLTMHVSLSIFTNICRSCSFIVHREGHISYSSMDNFGLIPLALIFQGDAYLCITWTDGLGSRS